MADLYKAPIGLAAMAEALGESSLDVAVVCSSANINPHSLIRPLFTRAYDSAPENFHTRMQGYDTAPDAEQSVLTADTSLTSVAEYDYDTSAILRWDSRSYGYFLPYVNEPQATFAFHHDSALAWKRFYPTLDNGSWFCLAHFDGYLHDASPANPIYQHTIEFNKQLTVTVTPGSAKVPTPQEVFANGGCVSIPAILSTSATNEMHLGCSLFHMAKNGYKFKYMGSVVTPEDLTQNISTGYAPLHLLTFGQSKPGDGTWVAVPWVAECGGIVNDGSANPMAMQLTPIAANGLVKYFGIRFSPGFEASVSGAIDAPKGKLTKMEVSDLLAGTYYEIKLTVQNTQPFVGGLTLSNFGVDAFYSSPGQANDVEEWFSVAKGNLELVGHTSGVVEMPKAEKGTVVFAELITLRLTPGMPSMAITKAVASLKWNNGVDTGTISSTALLAPSGGYDISGIS